MSNVEWPTTATAKAMLRQLDADRERSGYWRSRWAEDHSDQAIEAWLRSLLDWLETAGPVDTPPSAGPVEEIRRLRDAATPGPEFVDHLVWLAAGSRWATGDRPVEEIRADLAPSIDTYGGDETRGVRTARHWQLHFGAEFVADTSSPEVAAMWRAVMAERAQLLAEVEAAHRFERSVAVEREALLAEAERLREDLAYAVADAKRWHDGWQELGRIYAADVDALRVERDSLRGVVQAVEALVVEAENYPVRYKMVATRQLRAALAAAADAPQRPTFEQMLSDPDEQFDAESELLPQVLTYLGLPEGNAERRAALMQSIEEYRNAPPCAASGPAADAPQPARECEAGCGCRYGTTDPDQRDCACDGPCSMADPAEWGCDPALGGCGGDCPTCPSPAVLPEKEQR